MALILTLIDSGCGTLDYPFAWIIAGVEEPNQTCMKESIYKKLLEINILFFKVFRMNTAKNILSADKLFVPHILKNNFLRICCLKYIALKFIQNENIYSDLIRNNPDSDQVLIKLDHICMDLGCSQITVFQS